MIKKLIKICDIKNIFETRTLGQYKINYAGYHLISKSDFGRYNTIKQCVRELKMYYPKTKSILITKKTDFAVLKKIINEIEFDGIQLHYPLKNSYLVKALRSEFGKNFLIIQILTKQTTNRIDSGISFCILDNSYVGGTGQEVGFDSIKNLSVQGEIDNTLIAGGISSTTIDKYLNLNLTGFDIQSSVKKTPKSLTENTELKKIEEIAHKLGLEKAINYRQVGFTIQDIFQNNSEYLQDSLSANLDFLHVDVSDGFIGKPTDISKTIILIDKIHKINSHIPIQFHFYCKTIDSFSACSAPFLENKKVDNFTFFAHINRDNDKEMEQVLLKNFPDLYFSLDVKDIIDDTYPWEKYVKKHCILCVQSKKHRDRFFNINRSIKLLRYSAPNLKSISIDRGVEPKLVYALEDRSMINLISGSYLSSELSIKYKLLKEMLYE